MQIFIYFCDNSLFSKFLWNLQKDKHSEEDSHQQHSITTHTIVETIFALIHRLDTNTVFIFNDLEEERIVRGLKTKLTNSEQRIFFVKDYVVDIDNMYTALKLAFHDTLNFKGRITFLTMCNHQIATNIMTRAESENLLTFR